MNDASRIGGLESSLDRRLAWISAANENSNTVMAIPPVMHRVLGLLAPPEVYTADSGSGAPRRAHASRGRRSGGCQRSRSQAQGSIACFGDW